MMGRAPFPAFLALALLASQSVLANNGFPARFGTLEIRNRVLFFDGRQVRPKVEGNNALHRQSAFRFPTRDVLLFDSEGGTACPDTWYIVAVSRAGVSATPPFGSCGDFIEAYPKGEKIVVGTRGFEGPFEPRAEQEKAATLEHIFVYDRGVVTERTTVPAPR